MKNSFYDWVFNNLSFSAAYAILFFLFCLAPLPLAYYSTLHLNYEQFPVQFQWVLLLTFLYLLFIFAMGMSITKKIAARLLELTEATTQFSEGNFSIRVPSVSFHDEIGRQAYAFNKMAQKLQGTTHQLRELLNATSALASGDLTARIEPQKENTEFDQVARSFNKLAEIFEAIINKLHQIGIILTNSTKEIDKAYKDQERIIVEQDNATKAIALAADRISSTAKEFLITMNEVKRVAAQTSGLATKGQDSLGNMESIMKDMVEASTSIASKLAILTEKAGNITSVITTITKVADQTNLLSLNASIEAEKAGEFGRGFSVIAREIRRLADQTAVSNLDIERMVDEITTAVSSNVIGVVDFTQKIRSGVEQVGKVNEQFTAVNQQVQHFTSRFELISQGIHMQSTGAEQINEAISLLSHASQQTSKYIQQFQKTTQELNHAAYELRQINPFARQAPSEIT
ncbi:MAG: methyl-accepting chemotaxis protein [Candidatus Protochlamydia sp.]|nr:methyl-accepting chemotaxis protein [Candidatus Protochlamydia sp.]